MLPEAEILVVGEADVGVTVIDDIERLDGLHACGSSLATVPGFRRARCRSPGAMPGALMCGYGIGRRGECQ
jgi:hypothetical protein